MAFEYKYELGEGDKVMYAELTICCAHMSDAMALGSGFEGQRAHSDHSYNGPGCSIEIQLSGAKLNYCPWCGSEIVITKVI
jgi:hypothetical protein